MSDTDYVTQAAEARLRLLLADPRVKEAIAIQAWLNRKGDRANPAPAGQAPRADSGHKRPGRKMGDLVPGSSSHDIIDILRKAAVEMRPKEVADAMVARGFPANSNAVGSRLAALAASGHILRIGHARYITKPSVVPSSNPSGGSP